jgi:hypothetical protein
MFLIGMTRDWSGREHNEHVENTTPLAPGKTAFDEIRTQIPRAHYRLSVHLYRYSLTMQLWLNCF